MRGRLTIPVPFNVGEVEALVAHLEALDAHVLQDESLRSALFKLRRTKRLVDDMPLPPDRAS